MTSRQGHYGKKVCVYIDGFNLYHAVAELNDARLKWLNFSSLGQSFLRPGESLEDVYFFTAVLEWNREKQERHRNFIAAQRALGVKIVESKFKKIWRWCDQGERRFSKFEEKQTDVGIATTLLSDLVRARAARVILITADSDQVPLVKAVRSLFPNVIVTLSAPPGRGDRARELGHTVHERLPLTEGRLHAHRLPRDLIVGGAKVATMPAIYLE